MNDQRTKLTNVRRAVRLLAAYHTRLLDCLQRIEVEAKEASPGLWFQRWEPTHHAPVERSATSPLGRWGWDFVPLQNAWIRWSTNAEDGPKKPGQVAVYVQHIADDGYDNKVKGHRGPDPTKFKDAADCNSLLQIWIYALPVGTSKATWQEIEAAFEAAGLEDLYWDGCVHDLQLPGVSLGPAAVLRYVGWEVNMADLGTDDDLAPRILVPLRDRLRAIVVPATPA
jgi:hypothetical protein